MQRMNIKTKETPFFPPVVTKTSCWKSAIVKCIFTSLSFSVPGQYHLKIENAQLEDDTTYKCQAGKSESSDAISSNQVWLTVQSEDNRSIKLIK